jgi:transcriptional regulator with XRE-family HTH domain
MARAALNIGVRELAAAAVVSTNTITRLERGETLYPRTVAAVRAVLEAAGVEFTNGDTPGARLVLRLSTPAEEGDQYVFQCVHRGDRFSVRASKADLDTYDEMHAPGQPIAQRLNRLPVLVLPRLHRALVHQGRSPNGDVLDLNADDLR